MTAVRSEPIEPCGEPLVETAAELRVSYGEVDRMGVAYYGNYLRWFEMGRAEYLRARGKPYREIEADGLFMPVVEAHVRYRSPASYDDVLQVWTVPQAISRATVRFGYRVVRPADGALLAEGYTIHACLSAAGRARRFPEELLRSLARRP